MQTKIGAQSSLSESALVVTTAPKTAPERLDAERESFLPNWGKRVISEKRRNVDKPIDACKIEANSGLGKKRCFGHFFGFA